MKDIKRCYKLVNNPVSIFENATHFEAMETTYAIIVILVLVVAYYWVYMQPVDSPPTPTPTQSQFSDTPIYQPIKQTEPLVSVTRRMATGDSIRKVHMSEMNPVDGSWRSKMRDYKPISSAAKHFESHRRK